MESSKKFCVYVAKLDGLTVYVGEGAIGREKHVNSGISCIYELNKHHFNGDDIKVSIYSLLGTKKEALALEKKLIKELQPMYNQKGTDKYLFHKHAKVMLLVYQMFKIKGKEYDKFRCLVKDALKYGGYHKLISEEGVSVGKTFGSRVIAGKQIGRAYLATRIVAVKTGISKGTVIRKPAPLLCTLFNDIFTVFQKQDGFYMSFSEEFKKILNDKE